jgi:hypothetical protein
MPEPAVPPAASTPPGTPPAVPPAPTAPTPAAEPTPPWGDDFDPARAWSLIQGLRTDKAALSTKVSTFEQAAQAAADAERTDLERAIARAEQAEQAIAARNAADQRAAVLVKHNLSAEDAAFLKNIPDAELDATAEQLSKRLGLDQAAATAAGQIPGMPAAKLTPGHAGAGAAPVDPEAIADRIFKARRGAF